MLFDEDELIVSRYAAESINQLCVCEYIHLSHTAVYQFCMQLTKAHVAEMSCRSVD